MPDKLRHEYQKREFEPDYCGVRRRFSVFFNWRDLWIGAFWNHKSRILYICPLPMIGLRIAFEHPGSVGRLLKRLDKQKKLDKQKSNA